MMTESNRVIGFDLSLTCTGWAAIDGRISSVGVLKAKTKGVQRLSWYSGQIKELIWKLKPNLAVIENYAFGASHKLAEIGELGGVARLALYTNDIPFIEVPPTTLKKFVTGNGTSEKGSIQMYCLKLWEMELNNNNEADAFGLAKFGECYLKSEGFLERQTKLINRFKDKHK